MSYEKISEPERAWLEQGYQVFSEGGPEALKIERLSRLVEKNKSSFYHYFATLDIFVSQLLEIHISQARVIAEKESHASTVSELIEIILDHKADLLFNRQLRIHRENPDFESCFSTVSDITIPGFLAVWTKILGLEKRPYLSELIFRISIENFFLQITPSTLTEEWLVQYFSELQSLVLEFKKSDDFSSLNGAV